MAALQATRLSEAVGSSSANRRMSGGLSTHVLEIAFAWLLDEDRAKAAPPSDGPERLALFKALWAHEAWSTSGRPNDTNGDYALMGQFGYNLVAELARSTAVTAIDTVVALWSPVFALGPKGHYAIEHFLSNWFNQLDESTSRLLKKSSRVAR